MGQVLSKIESPRDLDGLSITELNQLAGEIRQQIIETVSTNGGHLAPSLGVVELTIALHRTFKTPEDKIIWDVGHQCYAHKIITGRRQKFNTLRQFKGLSGFPNPGESEHDAFTTGHSSTSISAALGMALARDLSHKKNFVVAVIGDGAMTAGISFEALNHAGHIKSDLIVVLNDNEMSIAPNVGALSRYLNRLRTDRMYSRSKEEIEQLLLKIPSVGPRVAHAVSRIKDSFKYLMMPGMFFEELGFTYLGPAQGHNIADLLKILKQARSTRGPVLVHVLTRKGKGYAPAEAKADKFHGIGPFSIDTGLTDHKGSAPSYTDVFGQTLVQLAEKDDRIVAITAAMPLGTGLAEFARVFPERFFDVGIAEQHAVTLGAALASEGYRPVVAIYSTFLQRAYDQILHDVCLQKLPVTLALDRGGLVGEDGPTHHGTFDYAYLRPMPGMVVMAPADEGELRQMLKTAIYSNGPAAVRYPRGSGRGVSLEDDPAQIPIGKAAVLRDGRDVALVAVGSMVEVALEAAQELEQHGVSTAVINARFVKPLDENCISGYAAKIRLMITLEEHVLHGGFGSSVLEMLNSLEVPDPKVICFGIGDTFVEHGKRDILLARHNLTSDSVVETALSHLGIRGKGRKLVRLKSLKRE